MKHANNNWDERFEDVNGMFEMFEYEQTSTDEIRAKHGDDIADHYANWLYMNIK